MEVADVLIYGLLMCEALGMDPEALISEKMEENEKKYPADLSRGKSDKYTEL